MPTPFHRAQSAVREVKFVNLLVYLETNGTVRTFTGDGVQSVTARTGQNGSYLVQFGQSGSSSNSTRDKYSDLLWMGVTQFGSGSRTAIKFNPDYVKGDILTQSVTQLALQQSGTLVINNVDASGSSGFQPLSTGVSASIQFMLSQGKY